MADPVFPKPADPDVAAAMKTDSKIKNLTIRGRRADSDHMDGTKACSVFDAAIKPFGSTSVEICREGKKITFDAPFKKSHLLPKVPPTNDKK